MRGGRHHQLFTGFNRGTLYRIGKSRHILGVEGGAGGRGVRGRRTVGDVCDEELDDAIDPGN